MHIKKYIFFCIVTIHLNMHTFQMILSVTDTTKLYFRIFLFCKKKKNNNIITILNSVEQCMLLDNSTIVQRTVGYLYPSQSRFLPVET